MITYANDGFCHNAEPGTYGHECRKPALWIGTNRATGSQSGFCSRCKESGHEARGLDWDKRVPLSEDRIERMVERMTDRLDARFMAGDFEREDYDRRSREVGDWATRQYAFAKEAA